MPSRIFLFVALLLISCGSDRYELQKDKSGNVVRLDKRTGETVLIAGDSMVKVKTPEDQEAERRKAELRTAELKKPRSWGAREIPQIGVTSVTLRTAYNSGELLYQMTISPVPARYNRLSQRPYEPDPFVLVFYDGNGFRALEESISTRYITHIVDAKGKPLSLSVEGAAPCSPDKYQSLKDWTLRWSF